MAESMLRAQAVLDEHLSGFCVLADRAEQLVGAGELERAAAVAELAAFHATWRHNGLFASDRIDRVLAQVSQRALRPTHRASLTDESDSERVLHVASMVAGMAGLQNLVRRWIDADVGRRHSVLVTQPSDASVPDAVVAAVAASGGVLLEAAADHPTIIERAQHILHLSSGHDMVILHLETEDVAPIIAMAHPEAPPSGLVNHADHCFWVGRSGADLIVNLRRSGADVCRERRSIDDHRLTILPTPVPSEHDTIDRHEARAELDVPDDAVVLVSVARAPKYEPRGGPGFPSLHLPVLVRHPEAHLFVVGPQGDEDPSWGEVRATVGDRLRAFGPRSDVPTFLAAADIYVDAHPLTSITSLLEAGTWGLPLVSLRSHGPDPSIWGADAPGLDPVIVHASDRERYERELARLISDAATRSELGRATRSSIVGVHTGDGWLDELERTYELLRAVGAQGSMSLRPVDRRVDDLDRRVATLLDALDGVEDAHYRLRNRLPERDLQPLLWRAWPEERGRLVRMDARLVIGRSLDALHLRDLSRDLRSRFRRS